MTRLALLADIHGNLPALEAVIADMAGEQFDQVIVAGDLINIGPFSRQVLETVFERGWVAIRGNHEVNLLERAASLQAEGEDRKARCMLTLTAEQLGDAWLARIAVMPDELTLRFADAPPLRVLHGAPGDPFNAVTRLTDEPGARALLAGVGERSVICGHYHLPFERQLADWQIINPGSAGAPKDGLRAASYAILEGDASGWCVEHRRVPVEFAPIFAEFERQDFVGRCGVTGLLLVEQFRQARPLIPAFRRWQREHYPEAAWSMKQAEAFLASGQLWHYLSPRYRYNRHLLEVAPYVRAPASG